MITCYFGVPGVGKTTLLTKLAVKAIKRKDKGKKGAYEHVYTNFYCKGASKLDFNDLNTYKITNSLILLDEITMDADNRDFKKFPEGIRDFFILHRHLGNDIIYATQGYDAVDKKIRLLTQELWYMQKSVLPFFNSFTSAKRIYRTIAINEHTSELVLGYRFCNFIESISTRNFQSCFRPLYYKYFDSFDEGILESRPELPLSVWGEAAEDAAGLPAPDVVSDSDELLSFDNIDLFDHSSIF